MRYRKPRFKRVRRRIVRNEASDDGELEGWMLGAPDDAAKG